MFSTMNAYTPTHPNRPAPSQTTAQHMRMLQRLAELGMELAELAAEQAKSAHTDTAPEPHQPDPTLAFTRLSRTVTAAIALHTTLQAGPRQQTPIQPADPEEEYRRRFLRQALSEMPELNPHLRIDLGEAHEALEARLANPANQNDCYTTLLAAVVADLGLPPNPKLSLHMQGLFDCLEGRQEPSEPLDLNLHHWTPPTPPAPPD